MTFDEVLQALRAARPGVGIGLSVIQGWDQRRARRLTFVRETDTAYRAEAADGRPVFLYVNRRFKSPGKICCADRM